MREFDWIARYFFPLATDNAALGLQDDAALVTIPSGYELAITTDTLNEQVHFLPLTHPALLAQKVLAINLSDLAAMGAEPRYYSLAISLPHATDETWVEAFAQGLALMQERFGIYLIGGDTTATYGPLSITITAFGQCAQGKALRRNGARAGDHLYVSGTIGDAVIGLQMAQQEQDHALRTRYELPTPRIALGQSLVGVASACMDVSDGLMQDIGHICRASNLGAEIELARIPLHPASSEWMEAGKISRTGLISGGDDYELIFTAAADQSAQIKTLSHELGIALTQVGNITADTNIQLNDETGAAIVMLRQGYQHF